jgi:hypothetical protein
MTQVGKRRLFGRNNHIVRLFFTEYKGIERLKFQYFFDLSDPELYPASMRPEPALGAGRPSGEAGFPVLALEFDCTRGLA